VAEVPKHLLEKAAARRAALTGGAAPTPSADKPAEASTAVAKAASDAPAVAAAPKAAKGGGAANNVPIVPAGPPPLPRGARFATMTSVFFLAAVPIWALFMFNAWATPISKELTPAKIGENTYNQCSTCHGANGAGWDAGGVGRALWYRKGEVTGEAEKTFPDPLDQAAFVWHGSCGPGQPYGAADREGGQHKGQQKGVMSAFNSLTAKEVMYVVTYERNLLGRKDGAWPEDIYAKTDVATGKREEADPKRVLDFADEAKLLKEIEDRAAKLCG
jgi:hypothetical protein